MRTVRRAPRGVVYHAFERWCATLGAFARDGGGVVETANIRSRVRGCGAGRRGTRQVGVLMGARARRIGWRSVFALLLVAAFLAMLSGLAFADPANSTVSFTTAGTLNYAFGDQAVLRGVLANTDGDSVATQTIAIERWDASTVAWVSAQQVVTNGSGAFSADVAPVRRTQYRAVYLAAPTVASGPATVLPHVKITSFTGPKKVSHKIQWVGGVGFKTTALPSGQSAKYQVVCQRKRGRTWRSAASWKQGTIGMIFQPNPDVVYSWSAWIMHRFSKRGSYRMRVVFAATADTGKAQSSWRYFKVK